LSFAVITATVVALAMQSVFQKIFNSRCLRGECVFGTVSSFFALLFFIVLNKGKVVFSSEILPYAVLFSLCYAVTTISFLSAIGNGSLALSSLILSYSLVLPTLYGILFLQERISFIWMIGFVLLIISLYMIQKQDTAEKNKITLRWLFYISIAFTANGFTSVIQRIQQIAFNGSQDINFMVISLVFCVIFLGITALLRERKQIKECISRGLLLSAFNGISNAVTNYLVMVSLVFIPASLFFPILSAGNVILIFFVSKYIFKESFSHRQLGGLLVGIISLVFMNIQ